MSSPSTAPAIHTPPESQDEAPQQGAHTTGDLARNTKCTLRTVRFYEQEGLIRSHSRGENGTRFFSDTELAKLQLCLDLRESGLSIAEVKALFALKSECKDPATASRALVESLNTQITAMQTRIELLQSLRAELARGIELLSECRTCEGKNFPASCRTCNRFEGDKAPRAIRLLWDV